MISKRNYSHQQKMLLSLISVAESIHKRGPFIVCIGGFLVGIVTIQKVMNHHVEINCPKSISVIVEQPTSVGPVYQCVSRAQLKGPAPTFKP